MNETTRPREEEWDYHGWNEEDTLAERNGGTACQDYYVSIHTVTLAFMNNVHVKNVIVCIERDCRRMINKYIQIYIPKYVMEQVSVW